MRVFIMSFIILFNYILQTTVFQAVEIFGVKPNTAVLLIVSYAILRGDVEGCIVGFFSGLLQDIFFGQYIGFFALAGSLLGYFCGKPYKDFFRENYAMPISLTVVGMLIYEFVFYIAHFLLLARTDFLLYVYRIILPETVYTVALAIPVYRIIYGINNRLEVFENKKKTLF